MAEPLTRISTRVALSGAVLCAIGRAAVVMLNVGVLDNLTLILALPSAGIGLLVGVIGPKVNHLGKA